MLTLQDIAWLKAEKNYESSRAEKDELQRQVEADIKVFLDGGGVITVIKPGSTLEQDSFRAFHKKLLVK